MGSPTLKGSYARRYEALGYTDPNGLRVTGVRGISVDGGGDMEDLSEEKKLADQKVFLTHHSGGAEGL